MLNIKNISLNSKILIALGTTLLIVLLIITSYLHSFLNKINYQEKTPPIQELPPRENLPSGYIDTPEEDDPLAEKNIINFLLIGKDQTSDDGSKRSDSIIIVTLNKKSKSIKLTSLMRDTYIEIPGYMDNRINAAYSLGGMDLLAETVEHNFSISIEGCAEVDFSGFKDIIDTIGGVDIELNKGEAYHISNLSGLNFTEGVNHLSGSEALDYSRIRYLGNADYERTERQRNVLVAVFDKLKDAGIKTLLQLVDDVFPLVTTNLTYTKILSLITNVVLMDISEIETYRIPADGEFTETIIRDMDVLVPNMPRTSELLKEYMAK